MARVMLLATSTTRSNSTFDLADFDGDGVRDTSAELINGSNTTIAVTRLDVDGNSMGTTNETLGDGEVANTVSWVLSGDNEWNRG